MSEDINDNIRNGSFIQEVRKKKEQNIHDIIMQTDYNQLNP